MSVADIHWTVDFLAFENIDFGSFCPSTYGAVVVLPVGDQQLGDEERVEIMRRSSVCVCTAESPVALFEHLHVEIDHLMKKV